MREIKFEVAIIANEDDKQSGTKKSDKKIFKNYIFNKENGMAFHPIGFDNSILYAREYTGLKDKNGKEIYEGDVLKRSKESKPSFVAVIEFKNGMFGGATMPYRNHFITMSKLNNCDSDGCGYDEVIGNIYENPELLKSTL